MPRRSVLALALTLSACAPADESASPFSCARRTRNGRHASSEPNIQILYTCRDGKGVGGGAREQPAPGPRPFSSRTPETRPPPARS